MSWQTEDPRDGKIEPLSDPRQRRNKKREPLSDLANGRFERWKKQSLSDPWQTVDLRDGKTEPVSDSWQTEGPRDGKWSISVTYEKRRAPEMDKWSRDLKNGGSQFIYEPMKEFLKNRAYRWMKTENILYESVHAFSLFKILDTIFL